MIYRVVIKSSPSSVLLHKVILWECEELEIRKEKVPTKIKYPAFRDMPEKTRNF